MRFFLTLLSFLFTLSVQAQLSGKVSSDNGEPLSYATIYVQDSYTGTTSNDAGDYTLSLESGTYQLVFQYVGYKQDVITVEILTGQPTQLDVTLQSEFQELEEIVIAADAEDPAYAIIRKAISNREKHLREIEHFTADLYIKGLVRTKDAPAKFLGIDVGDMEGILDSNRQGIVYLSESKSKIYYEEPDKIKEVLYASKIAGDVEGLSFNQYADVNFSFYNEHITFGRNLLSPLADNALRFYDYKLEGTTFNHHGSLVNKIKVIPKNSNDPLFSGYLHILDDSWRIYTAELQTTGIAAKNKLFDFLRFKQIYRPVLGEDKWILFSQVMDFELGFFAFKFNGTFTYFFSDHSFEDIDDSMFSRETFKADMDANKKDSIYWSENRPIPITLEEEKDYRKKDSLEVLWNSKPYLDSLDRVSNKPKILDLLTGYTYSNSFKHRYITYRSPLNALQFNAVEGLKLQADIRYRQWNKRRTKYFSVEPKLTYGFGDKQFRPSLAIAKRFNSINNLRLGIDLGREVRQINEDDPVSIIINDYSSLYNKNSLLKIFETDFVKAHYTSELFNGLRARTAVSYEHRKPLIVNTDYSVRDRELLYDANDPFCDECRGEPSFTENKIIKWKTNLRYVIGQTYMTVGDVKVRRRSQWPILNLEYTKVIGLDEQEVNYDRLSLGLRQERLNLDLWGFLQWNLEVGGFLAQENLTDVDQNHFLGNEPIVTLNINPLRRYKRLPYYEHSTTDDYLSLFSEYHLEGKLMDKVPILKNTGITTVIGYNLLQQENFNYQEVSIGLENIGFKGVPLFRVDYVWDFISGDLNGHGVVIGVLQDF